MRDMKTTRNGECVSLIKLDGASREMFVFSGDALYRFLPRKED
jgi:hypothetical protein